MKWWFGGKGKRPELQAKLEPGEEVWPMETRPRYTYWQEELMEATRSKVAAQLRLYEAIEKHHAPHSSTCWVCYRCTLAFDFDRLFTHLRYEPVVPWPEQF